MRKHLLLLAAFFSFQFSFSQTDYEKRILHEFDSLKNILPKLNETWKVDCLNALARTAIDLSLGWWQVEADTARPYATQASKEAKRMGYKKGLGDSYVNLEEIDQMTFGWYLGVRKDLMMSCLILQNKMLRMQFLLEKH